MSTTNLTVDANIWYVPHPQFHHPNHELHGLPLYSACVILVMSHIWREFFVVEVKRFPRESETVVKTAPHLSLCYPHPFFSPLQRSGKCSIHTFKGTRTSRKSFATLPYCPIIHFRTKSRKGSICIHKEDGRCFIDSQTDMLSR